MDLVLLLCGVALIVFSLGAIARHDWLRLTRAAVKVEAVVVGYRSLWDDGTKLYAARLAFEAQGEAVEVIDQHLTAKPRPDLGTSVLLSYPMGRPHLARIPRPVVWTIVYALLTGLLVVLIAELVSRLA